MQPISSLERRPLSLVIVIVMPLAARLASRLVSGGDVQDAVSINVEGNFKLWNTTRSRRNVRQLKLAEEVVVLGASTLPFVYLYKYTSLVVGVGGEDFGLLGGDGSVRLDEGQS